MINNRYSTRFNNHCAMWKKAQGKLGSVGKSGKAQRYFKPRGNHRRVSLPLFQVYFLFTKLSRTCCSLCALSRELSPAFHPDALARTLDAHFRAWHGHASAKKETYRSIDCRPTKTGRIVPRGRQKERRKDNSRRKGRIGLRQSFWRSTTHGCRHYAANDAP